MSNPTNKSSTYKDYQVRLKKHYAEGPLTGKFPLDFRGKWYAHPRFMYPSSVLIGFKVSTPCEIKEVCERAVEFHAAKP